ncbi:MAG TPA: D-alanyl-D-alanine carboxypeptidase family protein [Candidatus Saccharimonadales bacterium]|nr:D-alanyl-D-alanine carboxypeptidase family protein [Candidatus Saccharimonadales bacterium]
MNRRKFFVFLIFCLLFFAAGVLAVRLYKFKNIFPHETVSALPDSLELLKNDQVTSLVLWLPQLSFLGNAQKPPEILAQSALVYDLTSQKVLYLKNPKVKLPMASLTKIMTAIIAIENPQKDDHYVVSSKDIVGEDSMGVTAGETYSLEELLYGLFLHSGNDTAEVLATNFPKGRTGFITAMNDKAKSLGLTDTHFTNPTGLEGDGAQYTTSYDLLVMTKYALEKFPLFDTVAATFDYHIPYTSTHKEYYLENETNLLTSYPGVKGVKTGFTPEAGLCLVTYLDYHDHKIIGVILNSGNRRQDMKELLDYALKVQNITPPKHS